MSTPFVLANLAATAAVWLMGALDLSERRELATPRRASEVGSADVLLSDIFGNQPDQDAGFGQPTGQKGSRRPSPVTEQILRNRDPIRRYREITGRKAKVRWWQRVQALLLLAVIIVSLGFLLAVLLGIMFLASTIILETVA